MYVGSYRGVLPVSGKLSRATGAAADAEILTLAKLSHPCVAAVYGVLDDLAGRFIVSELCG